MSSLAQAASCAPMRAACRPNAVSKPLRARYRLRAIVSERRNSSAVCSDDRCGRLSNHFGASNSAVAPTDAALPSTSISTRTKICVAAWMVTAPNRNGRTNGTGRSNSTMSRNISRGAIKASIQRALREKMLADALHQLGEHRIGHRIQRAVLAERSEEHTSELQSRLHLVCRLLLEK